MRSSWYRDGDFYQKIQLNQYISNRVTFRNARFVTIISEINVIFNRYNLTISLEPSPDDTKTEEVLDACRNLMKPEYYNVSQGPYTSYVKINLSETDSVILKQVFAVFKYFNDKYAAVEFPAVLITELNQIWGYCYQESDSILDIYQHVIPENGMTYAYPNPDKVKRGGLIELFRKNEEDISLYEYKKRLTQGANPHEVGHGGTSAVWHAVLAKSIKFLIDILFYGGNPFIRIKGHRSALDWARYGFQHPSLQIPKQAWEDKLNIITGPFSKLQKPLKDPIKIQKINFSSSVNQVATEISLTDKNLKSILKKSFKLSKAEKDQLYDLFSTIFKKAYTKDKLKKIFEEDLVGKNKLIELFFDGEKLVGFISSELIQLDPYPDRIIYHVPFSAFLPDYRGFASLHVFRMLFAIQQTYPSLIVGFYCTAISKASYDAIEPFLYFPKYKPPSTNLDEFMVSLLKEIYGDELDYYSDDTTSYVKENVSVAETYQKKYDKNDIMQYKFNEMLGLKEEDLKKMDSTSARGITILFFADHLNFIRCCHRLPIDFPKYLREFKETVRPMICALVGKEPDKRAPYLLESLSLFWLNEKKPVVPHPLNKGQLTEKTRAHL